MNDANKNGTCTYTKEMMSENYPKQGNFVSWMGIRQAQPPPTNTRDKTELRKTFSVGDPKSTTSSWSEK